MKHPWTRAEAWSKATAAIVGGFVLFVSFSLATAVVLPRWGVRVVDALALSTSLSVPVWIGASLYCLLASTGGRAWAGVGLLSLVLAGAVAGARWWAT